MTAFFHNTAIADLLVYFSSYPPLGYDHYEYQLLHRSNIEGEREAKRERDSDDITIYKY